MSMQEDSSSVNARQQAAVDGYRAFGNSMATQQLARAMAELRESAAGAHFPREAAPSDRPAGPKPIASEQDTAQQAFLAHAHAPAETPRVHRTRARDATAATLPPLAPS